MNGKRILAVGAHPDDIEFGCGGFLLDAAEQGANIVMTVLSHGEAGTHGNAGVRKLESQAAANMLGATLEFLPTEGDTRIRATLEITQRLAIRIRRHKPDMVLAPTGHLNQHPDHREVNQIVRDACRLSRYGKTPGLEDSNPHTASLVLFYDISSGGSTSLDPDSIFVDISKHVETWTKLMRWHESQVSDMNYIDLQLSRARVYGIQMGVHSAQRLYSESPLLASSSADISVLKGQRF